MREFVPVQIMLDLLSILLKTKVVPINTIFSALLINLGIIVWRVRAVDFCLETNVWQNKLQKDIGTDQ
jgi:hypothetical protein